MEFPPRHCRQKLIKIGAKVASHGRYVIFQMAEVAIPTANVPEDSAAYRRTATAATTSASMRRSMVMRSRATDGRSASECQGNGQIDPRTPFGTPGMPGAGPHLGSGLLGNPENRYHSSQLGHHQGNPGQWTLIQMTKPRAIRLHCTQGLDHALACQAANRKVLIVTRAAPLPGDFLFGQLPSHARRNAESE
jgi:hypothetical protein